jgi:hypothetical protein
MPSGAVKGYLTSSQNLTGSSATPSINMSAGSTGTALATDDFVFIFLNSSGGISASNTPTPPTGFTELVTWQAMGTSTTTCWALYVKRRGAADGNYTVPQVNINRTNIVTANVFWVDGANAAEIVDWFIGTIQSRAASGGTVNTVAPSVNTTVTDSMVFAFGAERTSAAETASDLTVSGTGWTKQAALLGSTAAMATLTIASKGVASAGASGNVTFTTINTQTANGAALQVIIPAAAGVPTFPDSVDGYIWDGTQAQTGKWYVAGPSDTVLGLDYAGMIHPGYDSIDAMLADDFFYCAHRGGSNNWPEMSMQGYTQSALRGYGALEISLARSSDGVWFGLHDASLDRTSLGTGGGSGTTYVASTMTWADIQTHDIRPATGAPVDAVTHQPYMELEDLLDAYINSHVIFVDPKSAGGNSTFRAELIAILKARSNWAEKIVAKTVPGNSTNAWATAARAAGFQVNAMFYSADNFTTYHAQADILGMDYNASGSVWTSIVALGKPVMAHVCPDAAAVATGLSKGADGAMVSGVAQAARVPDL